MDMDQVDEPGSREAAAPRFDRTFWDGRWSEVLRDHADVVAGRPPNEYLTATAASLTPGRALDAGCGHGAETLWLAARGWEVTAVDFSETALAHGRSSAAALGAEISGRITWSEGDLGSWTPSIGHFDLVCSLYVHVAGSVEAMVARLASGVTPGGTLLLVGHLPVDPITGAATPAAGQVQVTVDAALATLDAPDWEIVLAEDRPRAATGSGFDAVIIAFRRG
jgi:SAM-dependent methyltransferase